jgi:hypothetical protein
MNWTRNSQTLSGGEKPVGQGELERQLEYLRRMAEPAAAARAARR